MTPAVNSLHRSVSPPPKKRKTTKTEGPLSNEFISDQPSLAAIKAGEARIRDHLDYFAKHLKAAARPLDRTTPRLDTDDFVQLYQRNSCDNGKHFVIHQHNHPVAGVHYDLRLQFSQTSACSWAIPYGLPGNVDSRGQGRMSIETRVHNLWNNLIESASHATGSLLIWDTGEYEILPRRATPNAATTDDETASPKPVPAEIENRAENEKLIEAFRGRYIRLRLHGTRLPQGYTVTLRLTSTNDTAPPKSPAYRRRGKGTSSPLERRSVTAESSNSDSNVDTNPRVTPSRGVRRRQSSKAPLSEDESAGGAALASDDEDPMEAEMIRINNAYPGAQNTIGSVHQKHWYLSLDKPNSGFVQHGRRWVRDDTAGFEPFYVQGADVERSVVTGRLSSEVMADEGVEGFRPRKLWRPIMV